MLIDFHTHIFPREIAPRAITALTEGVRRVEGVENKPHTDATYEGLIQSMDKNGVDISVAMPIVTNPRKPNGVNRYAQNVRDGRVISFGSVHPLQENAAEAVRDLKRRGFIGIKLHPEFQHCYIDSPESMAVLKTAGEEGLLVMVHAGADIGMPPPVHCAPERLKNALGYLDGSNIIAAHMGGWRMWEDAYEFLAGTPIYMDTAFVADYIDRDLCRAIIEKHGPDKILFGSDSPWETPSHTLRFLRSLGLGDAAMDNITYKNALSLLGRENGNVTLL